MLAFMAEGAKGQLTAARPKRVNEWYKAQWCSLRKHNGQEHDEVDPRRRGLHGRNTHGKMSGTNTSKTVPGGGAKERKCVELRGRSE